MTYTWNISIGYKFLLNDYLNSLNIQRSRDYRQPPGNQCIAKRTQYKYICQTSYRTYVISLKRADELHNHSIKINLPLLSDSQNLGADCLRDNLSQSVCISNKAALVIMWSAIIKREFRVQQFERTLRFGSTH